MFKGLCTTKALKCVKLNDIDDFPQYEYLCSMNIMNFITFET